ncbi:MAG TPA: ATP synthase F1 subunit epsilon [Mesotoga infera]|jgi:F-type H+-transporting ATPase subunit epsilon|nr:ATP synthase F1 subunit epsilon [Mesotoga sp.]NLI06547.1 ATP synthase F1 subunit epsilon [Thermotogaceae bacterium]HNS66401.1 ATP synthase F1 subunit epsilon [Mesotoga infera]HOI34094.1 ATP synthase F1 subunit epsilon [Mesotoga infera]HON27659.1 ATP synthase F1 subunit epsilon [Mesotoga infera]
MLLKTKIVTPYGIVWEGEAEYISFKSVEGEIGFLPERAPAVMKLVVDVVEIRAAGVVHTFAVHGGYILQERDMTTIITDAAERPEEINVERARQRLKRAEELLEISDSRRERARNQAKLQRHMLRIKLGSERWQ